MNVVLRSTGNITGYAFFGNYLFINKSPSKCLTIGLNKGTNYKAGLKLGTDLRVRPQLFEGRIVLSTG